MPTFNARNKAAILEKERKSFLNSYGTEAANNPKLALGAGQDRLNAFNLRKEQLLEVKSTKQGNPQDSLKEYTIEVGKLAKLEQEALNTPIDVVKGQLKKYKEQFKTLVEGSPAYDKTKTNILAKENELTELKLLQAKYTADVVAYEDIINKGKLKTLQHELGALKRRYELLKEEYGKTSTTEDASKKYAELDKYQQRIVAVQLEIAKLDKDPEAAMERYAMDKETQALAQLDLKKQQNQKITDYLSSAIQREETFKSEEAMRAYQEAQEAWFKEQKLSDKLGESGQKAEAEALRYKVEGTLSSSSMFSELNADLAKRAQTLANSTGISQEYGKYGSGAGGYFARQAAKKQSAQARLKAQQEKLARSLQSEQAYSGKETTFSNDLEGTKATLNAEREKLLKLLHEATLDKKPKELLDQEIKNSEKDVRELERLYDLQLGFLNQAKEGKALAHQQAQEALDYLQETVFNPQLELTKSLRAGQEAMSSGLSTILGDWASGMIQNTEDVKNAFEAMGKSILQSMLKVVTDRTATMFTDMLLGKSDGSTGLGILGKLGSSLLGLLGGLFGGVNTKGMTDLPINPLVSRTASQGGFINGNYQGARHYAGGGYVSGTDIGHDIIPAYLRPSEYVLNPTATSALGKPFLDRLNSVTTGSLKQLEGKTTAPQVNVTQAPPVNVYVVSPDQQRQMGANDVVVSVEDNIMRNGSIKQLIKQVVSGQV